MYDQRGPRSDGQVDAPETEPGASPSLRRSPLPELVERSTAAIFRTLAGLRGRRALHPYGMAFAGFAVVHDGGRVLAPPGQVDVEVRLSRGVGLPHPIPDFNGVAVRFVDARGRGFHQDLLLAASGRRPGLRHLIVPSPYFSSSGYSTVLPYRGTDGSLLMFRCEPIPVRTLDALVPRLPLLLELHVATLFGPWVPAASVTIASLRSSDAQLRFDPWNTGPEIAPFGRLNRLRGPAYAGSRSAAHRHRGTSTR